MTVSKPGFLYLEYGLCLCCFSEIISAQNQRFEFAFTLTLLIRATEAIALTDLYTKPKHAAFTQLYSISLGNESSSMSP